MRPQKIGQERWDLDKTILLNANKEERDTWLRSLFDYML